MSTLDGPDLEGADSQPRTPAEKKARRRKIRRIIAAVIALVTLSLVTFVGVVYATTDVPQPDQIQTDQVSVIYYADGTTELARLGEENRTDVALAKVPDAVRNAVLSAENRSFYSDPGFSPAGIARAAWNNLTGGSTQGGSTITQQYVKNAFLSSEQTYSRKFKELILSVKIDRGYSKDQILEWYLNTIYFGRGAYGIEAAAQTYFGTSVDQLTPFQGAVLASSIKSPALYDPESHPEDAQARWNFVLDGMVSEGWLSATERAAAAYPPVQPRVTQTLNQANGPEGLIVQQVKEELARNGVDESRIYRDGLRITTTVSKPAQDAAVAAVTQTLTGQPANLRSAMVSVDPATGAVVAYYGGPVGTGFDYAQAYRQPGSSFKPYVLATALGQGIGDNARRNGSSPQTFPDREQPVRNSGNEQCASCTLKQAITESLNTVFYGLALEVGPTNVAATAHAAGVGETGPGGEPTLQRDGTTGGSIGIGEYEVRPIDQAVGFATFADGGVQHDSFFVSTVTDAAGKVLYEHAAGDSAQAVSADVASDVTFALEDVAAGGNNELVGGRQSAAKTGTTQLDDVDNKDAWMVGYTPQLSTAVWIGSDGSEAIRNADDRIIYGSGLPGQIWKSFMDAALTGQPNDALPSKAIISGDGNPSSQVPAPTTTRPPTTQASTSTETPTTTEVPTTTETPTTTSDPPTTTEPPTTTRPTRPTPPPTTTAAATATASG